MKFWPFRRKPKKPKFTIALHGSVQRDAKLAAAWTVYAGSKALLRMGDAGDSAAEIKARESPFEEECYARDGLAEFWKVQPTESRSANEYLQLLSDIRDAGFVREYVWRFLREASWPEPTGLNLDAFTTWWKLKGLSQHTPQTLAFIMPA